MKTLEEIKNEVAADYGWLSFITCYNKDSITQTMIDEIANRYALEASKETQKRCAQKASTKRGYYSDGSAAPIRVVDEASIMAEANIPQELRNTISNNG